MTSENHSVQATVGTVDDFEVGEMKLARVGEHRIAVIRTPSGIHAIDNACPHQGYGLTTGTLDGELVTCQWHNWKFRASDGKCLIGEEDVASHRVEIDNGDIVVTVDEPADEAKRAILWPSLMSGIANDYGGQIARDALRLLDAGATPVEIVWEAVKHGAPRTNFGIGHEFANAADCLQLALRADDPHERSLAVVQALVGVAEQTRAYDPWPIPDPDDAPDLVEAIEAEDVTATMAKVVADVRNGVSLDDLATDFITAVSQHHYNYGHGAIYVQKAFELLANVPLDEAEHLLPHIAATLAWGTREDTLPYMKKAMAELDTVDLAALANAQPSGNTDSRDQLVATILDADDAPISVAAAAGIEDLGVEGVLDAVSLAVSHRLLRHDVDLEFNTSDSVDWLSITHGLTYANAARWAWNVHPGPDAARLALFTVWLAYDTGRGERRNQVIAAVEPTASSLSVADAIARRDAESAVGAAMNSDRKDVARALEKSSLSDHTGAFIVQAHLVKMAVAAAQEADATDSSLPLAATARFLAGPRLERFVETGVVEADRFITTGRPPVR